MKWKHLVCQAGSVEVGERRLIYGTAECGVGSAVVS